MSHSPIMLPCSVGYAGHCWAGNKDYIQIAFTCLIVRKLMPLKCLLHGLCTFACLHFSFVYLLPSHSHSLRFSLCFYSYHLLNAPCTHFCQIIFFYLWKLPLICMLCMKIAYHLIRMNDDFNMIHSIRRHLRSSDIIQCFD